MVVAATRCSRNRVFGTELPNIGKAQQEIVEQLKNNSLLLLLRLPIHAVN